LVLRLGDSDFILADIPNRQETYTKKTNDEPHANGWKKPSSQWYRWGFGCRQRNR